MGQTFLALLLAHLCADFPLQTDAVVSRKKSGAAGYLIHGAIHLVTAIVVLLAFTHNAVWSPYTQSLLLAYAAVHIALDYSKQAYMKARKASDSTGPFIIDQALHVCTVAALAWALTRVPWVTIRAAMDWPDPLRRTVLLLATTYVAVIFAGGYLVRSLTRSLTDQMHPPEGEDRDSLRNAGLYIGWLERFLVLTALLVRPPAMIGLILTGKSIARLAELKGPKFAEYFLIGTLLSVSLALSGGIFLMLMLYGTALPK